MTFPIFQIDYSDPTIATATIVIVLIGPFLLYFFLFRGVFLVSNNQIGVLIKKFGGQRMPQGQIVARKGQIRHSGPHVDAWPVFPESDNLAGQKICHH